MSCIPFIRLSKIIQQYLNEEHSSYHTIIQAAVEQAEIHNPWFIKPFVHTMLSHIAHLCSESSLQSYSHQFYTTQHPKKVLVIAAGNIPMVSFHDVLSVLLSGHYLIFKPSSKDTILMKMLLHILQEIEPAFQQQIFIQEQTIPIKEIDALIATGTNNTAIHLHQYFAHLPRIVRNNRTSIAILDGSESTEDLKKLADDILLYFGLGCRNVSKIFIPKDFDIQKIFQAVFHYGFFVQHHKYINNYDYYRSIYLLNKEPFLENNFLLLKESPQLHAPVANLFYERYHTLDDVWQYIQAHPQDIQCIIGKNYVPYGQSQFPDINDFADGINTKEFLMSI